MRCPPMVKKDHELLKQRIGQCHLDLRLGIERDDEARIFGQGRNFFHIENWYSIHALIRNSLRLMFLHRRGQRNARRIQLRHNTVSLHGLPKAFDGYRILHISDPHLDMADDIPHVLIEAVRPVEYDLCVITGDFRAKTYGPFDAVVDAMARVRAHLYAPVYGILGNHDTIQMVPGFEALGIQMLLNESVRLERDGEHIFIAGIDDPHYYRADNLEKATDAINRAIADNPEVFVRCSSEFPFTPAMQRLCRMIEDDVFGDIIEVESGFLHSSDMNVNKPINWKRMIQYNGEYGVMGDLGIHPCHVPFRAGWKPLNVRAYLSDLVKERPDGKGGMAACETWDNATMFCEAESPHGDTFPMTIKTQRIAPGEKNTWYITIRGMKSSVKFTTKNINRIEILQYEGNEQAWQCPHHDLFSNYTIERKGYCQRDRYQRKIAAADSQHCNPDGRQDNRNNLQLPQPLTQEQVPDQNQHQWINVVAQAGLEYVFVLCRPHKNQPIDRDDDG